MHPRSSLDLLCQQGCIKHASKNDTIEMHPRSALDLWCQQRCRNRGSGNNTIKGLRQRIQNNRVAGRNKSPATTNSNYSTRTTKVKLEMKGKMEEHIVVQHPCVCLCAPTRLLHSVRQRIDLNLSSVLFHRFVLQSTFAEEARRPLVE